MTKNRCSLSSVRRQMNSKVLGMTLLKMVRNYSVTFSRKSPQSSFVSIPQTSLTIKLFQITTCLTYKTTRRCWRMMKMLCLMRKHPTINNFIVYGMSLTNATMHVLACSRMLYSLIILAKINILLPI